MRKLILIFLIFNFIPHSFKAERIVKGIEAESLFENAMLVRYKDKVKNPNYIEFKKGKGPQALEIEPWILSNLHVPPNLTLTLEKIENDGLGWLHYTYVQKIDGIIVEFAPIKVHLVNERVHSMNGYFLHREPENNFSLSEESALNSALEHAGATTYKWEIQAEEDLFKLISGKSNATYYPKGEKIYMPFGEDLESNNTMPCWKFDIYSHEPESRNYFYISAINGDLVYIENRMHHNDSVGTAQTSYSGLRNITTDYMPNGTFRLLERSRADTIWTLNNNNMGGAWPNGLEFLDSNNVWIDTLHYSYALDAHWGVEKSWDYFMNFHGRNSIDGNGANLYSLVHYGTLSGNASWNGTNIAFWPGNTTNSPLTCLDVVGHELTHGLINYTANLRYLNESGALNESFADIFGALIEHYVKPDSINNWLNGEEVGSATRSYKDPNSLNQPDTYKGNMWYTGSLDNGGVHINSGVQNYWFYLLTMGGSGINDNSDSYNVTGIGWDRSDSIVYRNLVYYLTSSPIFIDAVYEDARFYSIMSAKDLYGNCSQEMISTWNAWYAVGLGEPYTHNVQASFYSSKPVKCKTPSTISFKNTSNFHAQSFLWDFGDGNSSTASGTMQPVVHTYNSLGKYTVTLAAYADSNNACGTLSNSESKFDYVDIQKPLDLILKDTVACINSRALVYAQTSDDVHWFDSPTNNTVIYEGNPFISDILSVNTTFYAESIFKAEQAHVGPADNSFGAGGPFNGISDQFLLFTAFDNIRLDSVTVYSNSPGERIIQLRDSLGKVLQTKSFDFSLGKHQLHLDFQITKGKYQLGIDKSKTVNLYRNNSGAAYPYIIEDVVSISGSSSLSSNFYYYFYDWVVRGPDCAGNRFPVMVEMDLDPNCIPLYNSIDEHKTEVSTMIFPNPTTGNFQISFEMSEADNVTINITDINGQQIEKVFNEFKLSGQHIIEVKRSPQMKSGLYFIQLIRGNQIEIKKLMIR